jgi:serine/threonine protein kinase
VSGNDLADDLPRRNADDSDDDNRIVDAVKRYMQLLDAGKPPAMDDYLTQHADIADELRPSLEGLAMVHRAGPVKPTGMVAPDPEFTAKPIGDFQIIGELGRGGMGVVYEAVQLSLGRNVALKVLPFASGLDDVRLKRFHNEAQAAAALHHTNIVPVYAVGSDRGVHYYAMQMIDGQTLGELIETVKADRKVAGSRSDTVSQRSTMPTQLSGSTKFNTSGERLRFFQSMVRIIVQAAQALDYAHSYGIVHRDIKPGNLLLDSAGKTWVADFGLAQVQDAASPLTRTGDPMGTLKYMSPEQAAGNRTMLDHRTDIYSLGVTLYELLTMTPAIRGEGYREMLNEIAEREPVSPKAIEPSLPTELDTIVRKAIAKAPGERYATARAMAEDLQSWLDDKPIKAKPPTALERLAKWRRRNSGLVAVASALLFVSTLALAVTTLMVWREQHRTREALARETLQRQLAEQNFNQARSAVDSFSNLAESELAYRGDLQDLRRSFLETSLEFYRDFLDGQADDPDVQNELATTSARVEKMVDELRVLDNVSPLMHLSDPAVQVELSIDDETAQLIEDAIFEFQSRRQTMANQNPGGLSSENEEMTWMLQDFDAFISKQLSDDQLKRLRQIARQKRLPFTFKTSEVVAVLGLTRQQRIDINRIIEETRPMGLGGPSGSDRYGHRPPGPRRDDNRPVGDRRERIPPGYGIVLGDGPPPERFGGGDGPLRHGLGGDRPGDLWRSSVTKHTVKSILEILTPQQRGKWDALVGEPFEP